MIHGRRASTDEKGRRRTSQHPKCMTLLTKMHMGTDLISEQWEKKKPHCKTCNAKLIWKSDAFQDQDFGNGTKNEENHELEEWHIKRNDWAVETQLGVSPNQFLHCFWRCRTLSFSISFLGCEKEVATHFSTVGIYFGLVGPFKRKTHRGHGLPSPPKQKLHNGCHKITKKRSKSGGAGNFLPHLHPNSVRIFSVL